MERYIDQHLAHLVDPDRFAFYKTLCQFADREIAPHVVAWERAHKLLPDAVIAKMAHLGLFGLTVSEEYGGQGGSITELVLAGLALGYYSQSVAITTGAASSLGTKPVQIAGTSAQKKAHLPDLAAGKRMFAFGLSEPGRGSDAGNPEVKAERVAEGWKITGEKCWSTNAHWASHVVVHALTNPQGANGQRTTCFIVPTQHSAVTVQEMGGKQVWPLSSTGSIRFDGVVVGEDAVLGEVNQGFRVMLNTLNGGRLLIAALALSSLARALDLCRNYAQERTQFSDKPIGRFQRVQDVILDMDIALHQGLAWLWHGLALYEAGTMPRELAAKIKIECTRRASDLLTLAMEICGGVACLDEFGLIQHHRDLFVCRVGEGSNFVLKTLATKPLMPNIELQ